MAADRSTAGVDRDNGDIVRVAPGPTAELITAAVVAVRAPALAPDALARRVSAVAQELSTASLVYPHALNAIVAAVGAAHFAHRGRVFLEQADLAPQQRAIRQDFTGKLNNAVLDFGAGQGTD